MGVGSLVLVSLMGSLAPRKRARVEPEGGQNPLGGTGTVETFSRGLKFMIA